ncbi:MAG: hypothetical protein U0U67_13830 [Chitinophagales bacterium]
MIFFCGFCKAQNGTTTSTTKTMTMTFEEYSEGDYPHFIFKDVKTGQEYDFRFLSENKLGNLNLLLDDDNASFGSKANPKYLKKKFTVVAIKKSVLDSDLEGNTIKTKAWVISKITIVNSNQTNTTSNKLPFVGKRWYHFGSNFGNGGTPYYFVEIQTNGDVYFGYQYVSKNGNIYNGKKNYSGKYKELIPCNANGDDESCQSKFYKITSEYIYSVDKNGNVTSEELCCNSFEEQSNGTKCKCSCKLSSNQYE